MLSAFALRRVGGTRPGKRSPGTLFQKMRGCTPCPWVCWGPRRAHLRRFMPSRARHRDPRCRPPTSFPVAIGEGSHPFPFRTRKLSPPPPMVLQAQVCGRVGHCRGYIEARRVVSMRRAFSFAKCPLVRIPDERRLGCLRRALSSIAGGRTFTWSIHGARRPRAAVRARLGQPARRCARRHGQCTGCDLYRHATQTVFGEGTRRAEVMLVGEQPGDEEDTRGEPFVGPAGRVLDAALARGRCPSDRGLRDQCRQALQARVARQVAHPQEARRGRGARLSSVARGRDPQRRAQGHRLPRRHRRTGPARSDRPASAPPRRRSPAHGRRRR